MHIFKAKFLREVVKKGGLCNINVWRDKAEDFPWKDSIFLSAMYIANIPAGMQYWQKEIKSPCIQTYCFRSPAPRRLGSKTNSAEYVKVRQHQKHGYHPLQHEPAFPDDKFKVAAGLSCMLSVGA